MKKTIILLAFLLTPLLCFAYTFFQQSWYLSPSTSTVRTGIVVTPSTATKSYAIEESVPYGLIIATKTMNPVGTVYQSTTPGKASLIKYGVFFDSAARVFNFNCMSIIRSTYVFVATCSINGVNTRIIKILPPPPPTPTPSPGSKFGR